MVKIRDQMRLLFVRPDPCGSVISLIALTILRLLIFHEAKNTVAKVITEPSRNEVSTLIDETFPVRLKSSELPENIFDAATINRRPIPIPAKTPIIADPRPYIAPSNMKSLMSCCRCIPTARAIPISLFRSAASMENIKNISNKPTPIENNPKVVKKVTNRLPIRFANSTKSAFIGTIFRPFDFRTSESPSLSSIPSEYLTPSYGSPLIVIRTPDRKPSSANRS